MLRAFLAPTASAPVASLVAHTASPASQRLVAADGAKARMVRMGSTHLVLDPYVVHASFITAGLAANGVGQLVLVANVGLPSTVAAACRGPERELPNGDVGPREPRTLRTVEETLARPGTAHRFSSSRPVRRA